jgi:hypothetical protein
MKEYDFYDYYKTDDKIKIYSENIYDYFNNNYKIIIDSVDFDKNQNVVLFIEGLRNVSNVSELEKELLEKIEHLNDIEIKNFKIILKFDCENIQLC